MHSAKPDNEGKRPARAGGWNRVGLLVSAGCAMHCTLLPILALIVPASGVRSAASDHLEWGMVALTVLLGTAGHCDGYLHHHGQAGPARLFLFGVGVIVLACGFDLPTAIVPATFGLGGVLAAGAQLLNVRYCRASRGHAAGTLVGADNPLRHSKNRP